MKHWLDPTISTAQKVLTIDAGNEFQLKKRVRSFVVKKTLKKGRFDTTLKYSVVHPGDFIF